MEYHVLASGSKGNSTFVYTHGFGILIDCGISKRQLLLRLEEVGYTQDDINCVLVTHDHSDHKKNIHIFSTEIIYAGMGCIDGIGKRNILKPYQSIGFGEVEITPLSISHDATSPLAFVIDDKINKLVYMTDTGYVNNKNIKYIENANYYIIESNHDINMLMDSNRPLFLKKRILSDVGHLSNDYSARLICKVLGDKTKDIILAHLSQEANTPELAMDCYCKVFEYYQLDIQQYNVKVASQITIVSGGEYIEDKNSQCREDQREVLIGGN